jgi:cysteine desulfurase/selenocysteine lyase
MNSSSYADDYGPFGGRVWFNCAHQGPLSKAAISAAQQAIREKTSPHLIGDEEFTALPNKLKTSLAHLVGAPAEDIILGNSASYGLHLLRNGMTWNAGDEILALQGDFPATIYPWLGLRDSGVRVRLLSPRGNSLTADELAREIMPSTRLVCISWVNPFNGSVLELSAIGQLCRDRGIVFALNGSQGVGALQINVEREPIDVIVSCGYKWLCGPYGTGFCWIKPELRNRLRPAQTYWLPQVWGQSHLTDYIMKKDIGAAAFDVFCTANFLNFMPWLASIDYLLGVGIATIEEHNRALVEKLVSKIDKNKFCLVSPSDARSAIVVISHVRRERNSEIHTSLAQAGIDIALRDGNLRFSLHLYNTLDEVIRTVTTLNSLT